MDKLGKHMEGSLVEPITNAARPGTLAGLSLTVLKFSAEDPFELKLILLIGAILFLISSLFIFFHTIYPTRKVLWMITATTFLIGLCCSIISSILLLLII